MHTSLTRRQFLQSGIAATALGAGSGEPQDEQPITIAVIGTNGRGTALACGFASVAGTRIAYVCDVDERAIAKTVRALAKLGHPAPKGVRDLRRILDDASLDALVIATPDHWHASATILGCAAGKHVYVEKPCSHNPLEGELMVRAARKHARVIQVGLQRRSRPKVIEAIEAVRSGAIGSVSYARAWYANARGTIGRGKRIAVPGWLDWDLWQGPAPRRPFQSNVVHYSWHWFWHWGTGELGNNGVHAVDLCRWGLEVDFPTRVTSCGGRYRFDDDQESPDTQVTTFEFGGKKQITWEGLSCNRHGIDGSGFGASFHGEGGTVVVHSAGYRVYDAENKEVRRVQDPDRDAPHLTNFLAAIRKRARLTTDIEEGHKSTLLCHLGNIAQRVRRPVTCDPENGHIRGDQAAAELWRRDYEEGWELRV